jgi:hypothetical protein
MMLWAHHRSREGRRSDVRRLEVFDGDVAARANAARAKRLAARYRHAIQPRAATSP